jgi:CMP-N,N'-diacetyllegionaminic acid synthase
MNNQIYCIDIDGTICSIEGEDYTKAKPYYERIKQINNLYDNGNKIIYFTARGYVTKKNWEEVTLNQFENWGVKYHELKFGKPNAEIYIDDKARDPFSWFSQNIISNEN